MPIEHGIRPAGQDVKAAAPGRSQRIELARGTTPPPISVETAPVATTWDPPSITDGVPTVVLDDE